MLKQEIKTKILQVMEARLKNKIDAIIKVVEKEKAKFTANNEVVQICWLHHLVTQSCKFSFNIQIGLNSACKISTDNHT